MLWLLMSKLVKTSNKKNTIVKPYIMFNILVVLVKVVCRHFKCPIIGSGKGISPLPSHGTGREPLDSSGSSCSESLD
jgi:hypothetical protein